MTIFDVFIGIAVLAIFILLFIKRDENVAYGRLDKLGIITNFLLGIFYIPLSVFSVFSIFFLDNPPAGQAGSVLSMGVLIGLLVTPISAIAGIFLSVAWRRAGRSVPSFIIQFAGLISFAIMLLFLTIAGLKQ